MNDHVETLIVGGGISGLACARTLHDAGRPFLLVTDRLGGRMYHSPDGSMNFGATYINADYRHVSRFVDAGRPFRLLRAFGEPEGGPALFAHWRTLRFLRPLVRLVLLLLQLRQALHAFRRASEEEPQCALAPHFPLIDRLRRQPAEELIARLGLGALHEGYFRLAFLATCFTDPRQANALFYLGTLFPIVVPTRVGDFSRTYQRLTRGYADSIISDRVTRLERRTDGRWEASTAAGRAVRAANVVLAAPPHNVAALYPVPQASVAAPATILYARGQRRAAYEGKDFLLLRPEGTGVPLVWKQACADLVFSLRPRPDLDAVYRRTEVLASVTWKTAIVLSGPEWAPLVLEPGLYLAGDHNLCGLEDSFLSGRCAARHVLRSLGGGR
jgi:glycine/D-amino acid oxidase-like deaminating enzyme